MDEMDGVYGESKLFCACAFGAMDVVGPGDERGVVFDIDG